MTFKDEFKETIQAARQEEKRRLRLTLPDAEWWAALRDTEIKPALIDAQGAFNETGIGGEQKLKNSGSGMVLFAGRKDHRHHLTFTHSATNSIEVKSSESSLDELWDDRRHITLETIVAKVRAFVKLVAAHYPDDPPSQLSPYEDHGLRSF